MDFLKFALCVIAVMLIDFFFVWLADRGIFGRKDMFPQRGLGWHLKGNTLIITKKGKLWWPKRPWEESIPLIHRLEIRPGCTGIAPNMFREHRALESMVIPDTVREIGANAFYGCLSLRKVDIPKSVRKIGTGAFVGLSRLDYLNIQNEETELDGQVFDPTTQSVVGALRHHHAKEREAVAASQGAPAPKSAQPAPKRPTLAPQDYVPIPMGETIGDMTWCLENGVIHVRGKGVLTRPCEDPCRAEQDIVIEEGCTRIASNAFRGWNLRSVTFPSTLQEIGTRAFAGCTGLKSVFLPASVTKMGKCAFENCTLESVTFERGTEKVGEVCFKNCYCLYSVTLPDTIKEIGQQAFSRCTLLDSIHIPRGVEKIGSRAFCGCTSLREITIPPGKKELGEALFCDCTNLEKAFLLCDAEGISPQTFSGCASLETVEIDGQVDSIESEAFAGCRKLSDIRFGNVWRIAADAFSDCISMVSLRLPAKMKVKYEFWHGYWRAGFPSLERIVIPADFSGKLTESWLDFPALQSVEVEAGNAAYCSMDGVLFTADKKTLLFCPRRKEGEYRIPETVEVIRYKAFAGCSRLTHIHFPECLQSIEYSAFQCCESLVSASLPESATNLGNGIFTDCRSLRHVELPKSMEKIPYRFFRGCTSLLQISIPENVTEIGEDAFAKCTALQMVYIPESVRTILPYAFYRCTGLERLYIPQSVSRIDGFAFTGVKHIEYHGPAQPPLKEPNWGAEKRN